MKEFCNFCLKSGQCRYKCQDCLRFYCHKCKNLPKANICPIGHPIRLVLKSNNYDCDICFKSYNIHTYCWNDTECDLDICGNCWEIPKNYTDHNNRSNTSPKNNDDLYRTINNLFGNLKWLIIKIKK